MGIPQMLGYIRFFPYPFPPASSQSGAREDKRDRPRGERRTRCETGPWKTRAGDRRWAEKWGLAVSELKAEHDAARQLALLRKQRNCLERVVLEGLSDPASVKACVHDKVQHLLNAAFRDAGFA